jgi:hypothetical protein
MVPLTFTARSPHASGYTVRLALILVLVAPLLWLPGPAHASSNGQWAVQPTPGDNAGPAPRTRFHLDGAPGDTITDSVRVQNFTDGEMTFVVHGADAFNTARDGAFGLRSLDDEQVGLGSWIELAASTVAIPPHTQADIPFTIRIPDNATPGDHAGGIVAVDPDVAPAEAGAGVTLGVRQAVGVRMYVRVDGPIVPGLVVRDAGMAAPPRVLHRGELPLEFTVANIGNTQVAPRMDVEATGLFGRQLRLVAALPAMDLVPGGQTILSTQVAGAWPLDVVSVRIDASADGGLVSTTRTRAVVVSLLPLALLVLLAGLPVPLARWRRRRHRALVEQVERRPRPVGVGS